jgi:sarcosine oxidase subunit beta
MGTDVVVVGAGIHGCSVAMQLAERGAKVVVVEKTAPAAHASGANAGSIHHIARLVPELPLAEFALSTWHRMAEIVGEDCGFRPVGHLKIAESEEDMEILGEMCEAAARACSIREEIIGREQLRRLEPHVAPHCFGAVYSPDCGYALPAHTVDAMRRRAEERGVRFVFGRAVREITRRKGEWLALADRDRFAAPFLVNCAGAWGDRLARQAGDTIELAPLALQMAVLGRMPRVMNTVIGLTRRLLSIKQFGNGTVVIGGGYRGKPDLESGTSELDMARSAYNVKAAVETFPILARGQVVRCWTGIEGRSPDGLPIIGPGRGDEGIWHAFGFSTHGFYLGPAVGILLADLITGRAPAVTLSPFDIGRFTAMA